MSVYVIMPAYNAANTIEQAIESALSSGQSKVIMVIVDDGSTDNTKNIAASIRSTQIKIIELPRNKGIVNALNVGVSYALEQSDCEFVARLDADDICFPNRFDRQKEFLTKSDADLISNGAVVFSESILKPIGSLGIDFSSEQIGLVLPFLNPVVHPCVFARADIFRRFKYNFDFQYCEDYRLWSDLVKNQVKIECIREPLLYYRQHPLQITRTKILQQMDLRSQIFNDLLLNKGFSPMTKIAYYMLIKEHINTVLDRAQLTEIKGSVVMDLSTRSEMRTFIRDECGQLTSIIANILPLKLSKKLYSLYAN